ncbi:hypothetical protein QYM36_016882 [Artemia franciscana]|uniref:Peptidase A2 domain-containing protein n=1 Tax=Artemia franciscana TaxID=6661 RepID=A0AA88H9B4_ARTSF|nr:hypothetical protein QYM36_016882 [Artemia franciscana]
MELSRKLTNSPKQTQFLRTLYVTGAKWDLTNPVTVISGTRNATNKIKRKCKVRHVVETEKSEEEKTDSVSALDLKQPTNEYNWTIISIRGESPEINVAITIGQSKLDFEQDTGAAVSLISEQIYRNCLSSVKLKRCDRKLIAYTGHDILILGEANVKVTYKSQSKTFPLIVAAGNGPSLSGRNWLQEIKLYWNMIKAVKKIPDIKTQIMNKFSELFFKNLGKVKGFTVTSNCFLVFLKMVLFFKRLWTKFCLVCQKLT